MGHVEIETRFGRLRGMEAGGVRVFRGVRYASPLTGPRRFLPPEPPEPWSGTRDALRAGPSAPQVAIPWFGFLSAAAVRPGEDCLSLNVWTPGLDGARRPVLVWIHGGGFLVGSGATPVYDGGDLARRGDAVVVTLNYRLGALGYAHLGTLFGAGFEQSSNLGVRDQIAALEWVRDHIAGFGGDPGNVTVFGQSAGAMSIGALLGAPRARSLFHRAICMSGAADHVIEPEDAERVAATFVSELGGPPASHEVLGRIPVAHLMRAQRATMTRLANLQKMMVFLPAVDGVLIPEQPLDAVRAGAAAHIPLLVGTTLDEWKLFRLVDPGLRLGEKGLLDRFGGALAPYPDAPRPKTAIRQFRKAVEARGGRTTPGELWSAFQSARAMHVPATRLAEAQSGAGGRAHAYLFTWRPTAVRRTLGAFHALDIPFVFGSTQHPIARPLTGVTRSAPELSTKMQGSWLRFAREGQPGHDGLDDWPAYDAERRATMILGRRCAVAEAPLEAERVWVERVLAERPGRAVVPRAHAHGGRGRIPLLYPSTSDGA